MSFSSTDAMVSVRMHLTAFVDNRAFAEDLLQQGRPTALRWAVTAAFYAALHMIRAYAAAKGVNIVNHSEGETFMQRSPEVSRGFPTYKALKELSESARYFHQSMEAQHVEQALRKVTAVESLVMGKLAKKAPDAPGILAALRSTPRP